MKKNNKKIILFLFFIINLFPIQTARADGSSETIYIESAADLISIANKSSLDSWSENKIIILERDLDLTNVDFEGIPVFNGKFDGQNYTITGLTLDHSTSPQGLFRYVQKEGEIKNLNVEGKITPSNSKEAVGGIAGSNNGKIKNSSFKGEIEGNKYVGGIAGINKEDGVISNNFTEGTVYGEHRVGGIAGENLGKIQLSENKADINTIVKDNRFNIKELENIKGEGVGNFSPTNVVEIIDIGGISGLSSGIIQSSTNYGAVGYEQVGYNVGGIAGRQSGYINDTKNEGVINGRKDVGGIVGQIEPHTSWDFSEDTLNQLREELKTLDQLIDGGIKDSSQFSNKVSDEFKQTKQYINDARVSSEEITESGGDWLDTNIENINSVTRLFTQTINNIEPIINSAKSFIHESENVISQYKIMIENSKENFNNKILEENLEPTFDEIISSLNQLEKEMSDFSESLSSLKESLDEKDELVEELNRMKKILKNIVKEVDKIKKSSDDLLENIQELDLENVSNEDLELLKDGIEGAKITIENVHIELNEIFEVLNNFDGNLKGEISFTNLNKLLEATSNLVQISKALPKELSKIDTSSKEIFKEFDKNQEIKQSSEILKNEINVIEESIKTFRKSIKNIETNPEAQFETINPELRDSKDNLFQSLTGISNSMSELSNSFTEGTGKLEKNVQNISDQLYIIFDLLIDTADNLSKTSMDVREHTEDVSMENIDTIDNGKVQNSKNFGLVKGDVNIGGIAGSMAIEYDFDLEDDYTLTEKITSGAKYLLRAAIFESQNDGRIVAKKDNVGGIVGLMDFGYISNTIDHGIIESKDGSYVGGIAGKAKGTISDSYAKSHLTGEGYIGGVTGYGKDIFNSYSLVHINESEAFVGAIAGDISNEGKLKQNYFVHDELAGINGISYENIAEPMDYQELVELKNTPSLFENFELRFILDDEEYSTVIFDYEDSLSEDEIPELEPKSGYYGEWEQEDFSNLKHDDIVTGEYKKYVTTLASREKGKEDLSTILVDGKFTTQSTLYIDKIKSQNFPNQKEFIEGWKVSLSDNQREMKTIHYLPPTDVKKDIDIYVKKDNNWEKVEYKENGSYLLFDLEDSEEEFAAVLTEKSRIRIFLILSLLLLIISISAFLYKIKK